MTKKVVGWNIYLEMEDEEGNTTMEAWDVSNWLGQEIDNEYTDKFGDDE